MLIAKLYMYICECISRYVQYATTALPRFGVNVLHPHTHVYVYICHPRVSECRAKHPFIMWKFGFVRTQFVKWIAFDIMYSRFGEVIRVVPGRAPWVHARLHSDLRHTKGEHTIRLNYVWCYVPRCRTMQSRVELPSEAIKSQPKTQLLAITINKLSIPTSRLLLNATAFRFWNMFLVQFSHKITAKWSGGEVKWKRNW